MAYAQLETSFGDPSSPKAEIGTTSLAPEYLPVPLAKDFGLLSDKQRKLVIALCSSEGDRVNHLFDKWMKTDVPAERRRLIKQLEEIDACYPSGLVGYLSKAKHLLEEDSGDKTNHPKGWKPVVPQGETFDVLSEDYMDVERLGMRELGSVGFVVAAGNEGEGMGICRSIELATGTTYLQLYIESILAIERKYGKGKKLPLCIMTSNATNTAITELLRDNDNFGMLQKQITIVNQGTGVPIFEKSENKLVLNPKDEFNIQTATHGQGDVHTLLRKHRVVEKWYNEGIEWLMFLEDTNGLAFHNLALMLGMSVKHTLTMNMVAFPRKAKQATESIVKLINEETKETRTISVDYEQFDPLLRAHGYTNGDEADEATGYSPFPGSTNHQFVFNLKRYLAIKGTVPEFVVKAKDGASAHLECRMQDISSILTGRDALKVGYTCVPTEHCFSPVDTTAEDGAKLQQSGMIPRCAASGEADQYAVHAKLMRSIGCEVEIGETDTFNGVSASPAPQIIIKPDTACFPGDYSTLFPHPERIKISSRSSLVVSGPGVVIESLTLDGALVIEGNEKVEEQVVKNLVVKNDGWTIVKDDDCVVEDIAMRGYHLEKKETKKVVFSETILDKVARLSKCG